MTAFKKMATSGKQSGTDVIDYRLMLRSHANAKPSTTHRSTTGPLKAITSVGASVMSKLLPSRNTIKFYNRYDDYYEFTNFYLHPVHIDGHMWPTTEHYFQAQKFVGTPYYDHVRKLPFPRDAFQVSRDPEASKWIRRDWSAVKDDVMLKALRVKFQDESLKRRLMGTKDKMLIEHTSNDSYWGDGGDGRGLNKLGHLLMQVRDELRQTENDAAIGDNDEMREYSIIPSRIQRSNSLSNLSISSNDVTTRPTLDNHANSSLSFNSKKPSEKTRRNSIDSHYSSPKDLQPSNTTHQQSQITRYFRPHNTNTHNIGNTYSTGNNNEYNRRGNSDTRRGNSDSHQYSRGNSGSHSRVNTSSSVDTHSSGYSHHQYSQGNSEYSYSKGPYRTPTLTRKSYTSQAAVSTHINSNRRSKCSSNNGGYSSVTGTPSLPRNRPTHKNMSQTTSCSGSSLPTKTAVKFYGGTNNTYRGSNSPSTSYNIITHENY